MKTISTFATLIGLATTAWADGPGILSDKGGQTEPSAEYLRDDVQYFPTGPEFTLAEAEDEVSVPGENGFVDVGLGIESRFGLVFQFTLVDRPRNIHIVGLAIPVTVLARPTATGLAGFTHWFFERVKERQAAEEDEDAPKSASIRPDESNSGQTLPSAYYLVEDVQYFPTGPEFRLEADANGDDPWYEKFLMSEKAREIERNLGIVEPRPRGFADVAPASAAIVAVSIANPSAAGFAVAWQSWELVTEQFTPNACGPFQADPDALE